MGVGGGVRKICDLQSVDVCTIGVECEGGSLRCEEEVVDVRQGGSGGVWGCEGYVKVCC